MSAGDPITARLDRCYASAVHDVMRDMGLSGFVLPSDIHPLMGWTGFLSRAPAGHVVVCQPNDSRVAHMGELSAETLRNRGVLGYIVDGGCRDVELCLEIGLPIYCRYYTPLDVVGYWLPDAFDVPVQIGEVTIHPRDYVIADRDGVCVLPGAQAESIVAAAEHAVATENTMREAIRGGMDPQQAYLEYGKF